MNGHETRDKIFEQARVTLAREGLDKVDDRTLLVAMIGMLYQAIVDTRGPQRGLRGVVRTKGPAMAAGGFLVAMLLGLAEMVVKAARGIG